MNKMAHNELVEIGKKWLWSRCDIVVTELTTWVSETPDVIGWKSSVSTLIECKTNRQDFLRDKHKGSRRLPGAGVGNYRYYLTESTLCSLHEIPKKWGLLVLGEGGEIHCLQKPEYFITDLSKERTILLSCIRRIGQHPPNGISVRAYRYKTKCKASIGVKEEIMKQ